MTTADFLLACTLIALGILVVAFIVISVRIVLGPTLPDRVLALDMLVAAGIGFIAVVAVKTSYFLYLDIAIALGLVGFLATVAFARFILKRDKPGQNGEAASGPGDLANTGVRASSESNAAAETGS